MKIQINAHSQPAALLVSAIVSTLSLNPFSAHGTPVTDDFNDGNDNGWTRYDPIGTASGGALESGYSFPGGDSYRIQAVPSPDPILYGPGRAGAYRADTYTSNFTVTVDIKDWDDSQEQGFGLLARGINIGPGTTDGYLLTYHNHPGNHHLVLEKLIGEGVQGIDNGTPDSNVFDLTLTPGDEYRLVFSGNGSALSGEIYNLSDLTTPLGGVAAIDSSYTAGVSGVLSISYPSGGIEAFDTTDVTFDNFSSIPEPSVFFLMTLGGLSLLHLKRKNSGKNNEGGGPQ